MSAIEDYYQLRATRPQAQARLIVFGWEAMYRYPMTVADRCGRGIWHGGSERAIWQQPGIGRMVDEMNVHHEQVTLMEWVFLAEDLFWSIHQHVEKMQILTGYPVPEDYNPLIRS
jgi:hypothetical protein